VPSLSGAASGHAAGGGRAGQLRAAALCIRLHGIPGYASPVRTPRGRDILAACGQLKSETEKLRARARLMLEESLALGLD